MNAAFMNLCKQTKNVPFKKKTTPGIKTKIIVSPITDTLPM